jgi:hypothetical protein
MMKLTPDRVLGAVDFDRILICRLGSGKSCQKPTVGDGYEQEPYDRMEQLPNSLVSFTPPSLEKDSSVVGR